MQTTAQGFQKAVEKVREEGREITPEQEQEWGETFERGYTAAKEHGYIVTREGPDGEEAALTVKGRVLAGLCLLFGPQTEEEKVLVAMIRCLLKGE